MIDAEDINSLVGDAIGYDVRKLGNHEFPRPLESSGTPGVRMPRKLAFDQAYDCGNDCTGSLDVFDSNIVSDTPKIVNCLR